MSALDRIFRAFRRMRVWSRLRTHETELAEELEFHEQMARRDVELQGVSRPDASAAARRTMGNVTYMREESRAVWLWPWLESVWQDTAYAVRAMRRHWGVSVIAVAALASGIGLNTSLFTVFNAVTWRSWDVPEAQRMAHLFDRGCCEKDMMGQLYGFAPEELRFFASRARTIDGLFMVGHGFSQMSIGEERTRFEWVSADYFRVLGVRMARGRGFLREDDDARSPRLVIVISHALWQTRFGGADDIVGKVVQLEGQPFTVIGVTPSSFSGPSETAPDMWMPLAAASLLRPTDAWVKGVLGEGRLCCIQAAARLAPGATRADAARELTQLSRVWRSSEPGRKPGDVMVTGYSPLAGPTQSDTNTMFALMFAAVVVVLILACANVGNLLLARASARHREITTRMAIGASRRRVVRQLVTEGTVLAMVAGALGIALATWLPGPILRSFATVSGALHLRPDARVLAFTLALSAATCLLFCLPPALSATRPQRSAGVRIPLRSVFLSAQVALCIVLLIGSALLVRGVRRATGDYLGFTIADLSVVAVEDRTNALDSARTRILATAIATEAERFVPGRPVALGWGTPLLSFKARMARTSGDGTAARVNVQEISPEYFGVVGIPLITGRLLTPEDVRAGDAIVVNETLARRYWTLETAVGQTLLVGDFDAARDRDRPRRVVGVVRDARTSAAGQMAPMFYEPLPPEIVPNVLVRGDARDVADALRTVAAAIDSRLEVRTIRPAAVLDRRLAPARAMARIATALGTLSIALATIGMFGVFAFWVQQRTQEIGVRVALGARAGQVVRLVVGSTTKAMVTGLAVGLAGALGVSRLLQGYLFGLSPLDPVAYGVVAVILTAAGTTAALLPALRATRIDPTLALRHD